MTTEDARARALAAIDEDEAHLRALSLDSHSPRRCIWPRGCIPRAVQERLGNSRVSVTMDVYLDALATLQAETAAKLDRFVEKRA